MVSFIYFVFLKFNILVPFLSKCRYADEPSTMRYIKIAATFRDLFVM